MIQRIQTVYLILAFVAMLVCAYFSLGRIAQAVVAVVAAAGSLANIFLYKNRPLQANICWGLTFIAAGLVSFLVITRTDNLTQADFIGAVATTVVALLCWKFAARAINKDEKLVRSLDRIR